MAEKDGEPDVDIELDPPVEGEESDVEQQDLEAEEQDETPEGEQVDASGEQDDRGQQGEQRQQTRGESRQQRLANELRGARQREADLNRRLDTLIAGQRQPVLQGETPEARAQRLALLTPEERIREDLNAATSDFRRELQITRFQQADGNDRAAFEAKATVDPLYAKWKPKVEAELATLRQQNMNVDREKLMYYLIGKNAVEGRNATKGQQRHEAQRRVQRQQTRPGNSGSDVSADRRGNRNNSLERRLENQSL